MIQQLGAAIAIFQKASHNRWLRVAAQLTIVTLSLAYLAFNVRNAGMLLADIRLNWSALAASWLVCTVSVFLGALGWRLILRGLGQPAYYKESLRAHLMSNLAKYLPGYAWQLMGKAYLTKNMGVSSKVIGLGLGLELTQLLLFGAALAALTLPANLLERWVGTTMGSSEIWLAKSVALLFLLVLPAALWMGLQKRLAQRIHLIILPPFLIWASLVILLGWILLGISFWLAGATLTPVLVSDLPIYFFALSSSLIIGLLVVFVPGGLGVREGLMVFILSPQFLPAPLAVIVAILSRLIVTSSEITSAFVFEIALRRSRSGR